MCGITGFISQRNDKQSILLKQLSVLHHRGPDDQNIYMDKNVGLGHARLAIIDIQNAIQPMKSENGRYVLVFNGEIYNYLELRQHLTHLGYSFKTHSDTEVLLKMYIHYGKNALQKLNGMFAFAIYDHLNHEMFLARDHFGIKPLYYTFLDEQFIFASEIKAILKFPEVAAKTDWDSVHEYLTFQTMLKKHTLFQNIHKLAPASYLLLREGKIVDKGIYWELDYTIDDSKTEEQYSDELLLLLENSLNLQTRSDVPIGAYLSGGIDSSTVSILASKHYYGDFRTFSGGFKDSAAYDETQYAQLVSQQIKSIHHEIFPKAIDFKNNFEKIIYHMDYPEAGPGVFSQYMVSQLASQHVKVVLGGQGGDELFGGYTRYAIAYLEQALKGAIFETSEEGNHLVTLQSIIPNMSQLKNYIPLLKEQFKEGFFDPMDERYFRMINRSHRLHEIYQKDFLSGCDQNQLLDKFRQVFNHPQTKSYFNKMTHFDLKTLLPALLHVEDRMSMAVSIESRVPLLDYRIAELAARMPAPMKFAGGKTKVMLVNTVKNILPKEVFQRTDKMGFPTPINEWIASDLKEYALDILTSQKARERGLLNVGAIETQIRESGKFSRDIWGALNLEMWFRKFID